MLRRMNRDKATSIDERLKELRREYAGTPLDASNVDPDPIKQFETWLSDAIAAEVPDPHAMIIATSTPDGRPSARVVLLRGLDRNGLAFYTNYESRKGHELSENPLAAAVFFWHDLDRQVRVEGKVIKLSAAESDAYFNSRPRESQVAAWASKQSETISSREILDRLFSDYQRKYSGRDVPRPPTWGGFKLVPNRIEFWQGRPNRLHDRIVYSLVDENRWTISRLAP